MIVLGITGGVGMGKSACANLLRERGITVIDTDILARELVEPGQPALAEIIDAFGSDIVDSSGSLRRDLLAKEVFSNPEARRKLEAVLHPRIRAAWKAQIENFRAAGTKVAAVIIPLLFETKAEPEFDAVICVACTAATQRRRLQERGWSMDQITRRIQSQMPVEDKMARSHFVIWSDGSLDTHAVQLDRILQQILAIG